MSIAENLLDLLTPRVLARTAALVSLLDHIHEEKEIRQWLRHLVEEIPLFPSPAVGVLDVRNTNPTLISSIHPEWEEWSKLYFKNEWYLVDPLIHAVYADVYDSKPWSPFIREGLCGSGPVADFCKAAMEHGFGLGRTYRYDNPIGTIYFALKGYRAEDDPAVVAVANLLWPPLCRVCQRLLLPVLPEEKMSARELEILKLLHDGLTQAEVAEKLSVKVTNVKSTIRRMREKFQADTVEELVWMFFPKSARKK